MEGRAIRCSNCTFTKNGLTWPQILGSITPDGVLIIKRAHNFETRLKLASFVILCECGYQETVNLSSNQESKNYAQN